ncbi:50S ribosomal protein L10 [Clostridium sp. BJN0001]|uniref:50S ribosomal protein L10 n=1 Tax=Clostridium sp. BJN0001 TaxID=2930219 RepID=UPI001FD603FE|nr:50S ribosomal protein L10 [Clostridium sp. BJN0001]
MNKNREFKEAKVAEIKEKLEKATSVVVSKYQGLTVEEDTSLRKQLREAGIEYKVYKNSLVSLAAKQLGIEGLGECLQGPISIAFGYEDVTAAPRVLNTFAADHKKLELQAGLINGKMYDAEEIKYLATIPPRDVLIAKFLGSIKAPVSKFACVVNAIKEKKENEAE